MNFTMLPLQGIRWDEQEVLLGSTMEAVEAKLGQPDIVDQSLYYFDSELRFDFSEKGRLEFIEFLGGYHGNIQPIIYGIQAFQVNADELYRILADHNTGNIMDNEHGYSFAFPNIGIGIYRESIPGNVSDLISELEKLGINVAGNSDVKEEQLKSSHWATISLASSNYTW